MSANTAIAWTESTLNPLTGCTKINPGYSASESGEGGSRN
jgi:protein gp37